MRKERVRWYQQSADFVGVLRVMFSRLCGRVGVCAGKNSFERDHFLNCLPKRSMEGYALMSLRVLLKIWLRECFFLTLMRLYSYGYTRDTIFGRNFSTAVSTLLKESESVAHTRRTNTPTKEQHERPHVINGIVLRERERENNTFRACV
jgi:hypothetical protein